MYIHPCLVFVDILGKSVFHIFVKKKKPLEKPFSILVRIFSAPRPEIFLGIYILPEFQVCDPLPAVEDQTFVP